VTGVVYQRDASWYAHTKGGSGGRFHWPHPDDEAVSACGRAVLQVQDDNGMDPACVDETLWCRAPGCAKRYRLHVQSASAHDTQHNA